MLDLLRRAKARGLDILGIADHNTVAGYGKLRSELEDLELLEKLGRLTPPEKERLDEYRSLLSSLLVLPGFEFTATFGFHILALFPPEKPVRELEYLLLKLNVPPEQLDAGWPWPCSISSAKRPRTSPPSGPCRRPSRRCPRPA